MSRYLADTTVLIDHLRSDIQAKQFLKKHAPYLSTVTVAELIQGTKNKNELNVVLRVCKAFTELEITKKISNKAINLLVDFHLSHGLRFLDAIIASTAIENNLILVTKNMKDFRFITGLKIISQKEIF